MGQLIRAAAVDLAQADAARFLNVKRAGFDAVSLCVSGDGQLTAGSISTAATRLVTAASEHGLKIVSLSLCRGDAALADQDRQSRSRAVQRLNGLINAAAAFGASAVIVAPPPVVPDGPGRPAVPYRDALNAMFEALQAMSRAAEIVGTTVAVRAPSCGCLLSPVETRELIDSVNASCVGVCVDVEELGPIGCLDDWLATLRHRVLALSLTSASAYAHGRRMENAMPGDRIVVIEDY